MVDRLSKEHRSWNMSRIKSRDTKPEMIVRSTLHGLGFRFRLHCRDLPGCPDIVLPKHNTVIFVHGCFWHRHEGCKFAYTPKSRVAFWNEKFEKNKLRDKLSLKKLDQLGLHVIVVWECETENAAQLASRLDSLLSTDSK